MVNRQKQEAKKKLKFLLSGTFLFILLISSVVALVALGALYYVNTFSSGISGGNGIGSLFSAKHYGTFNTGGKGQGSLYSANIGLFSNLSVLQVNYGVDLIPVSNKTTNIYNNATYLITINNTGTGSDNYTLSLTNSNSADTALLNQSTILNLANSTTAQFTLAVGDSSAGNYTILVRATSQGNSGVYDEISITTQIINGPLIISKSIYYYAVMNKTNVSLYVSALNADSVWANITKPDANIERISLANNANTTFSNTSLVGRYNVTFYANDSYGAVTSAGDYFETFLGASFNFTILDFGTSGLNSSWELYYRNQTISSNSSASGNYSLTSPTDLVELKLKSFIDKLQVTVRGLNFTLENGKSFGMDRHNNLSDYLVTYGIENNFSFANSTIRISYNGTSYTNENYLKLFKCNNYNFTGRVCLGSWDDVSSSQILDVTGKGIEYLTTSFSGFSIQQGQYCGDGVCNNGETCSSCTGDCGTCSSSGGSSGGGGGSCVYNQNYDWECSAWSSCINEKQTRECKKYNNCWNIYGRPETERNCTADKVPEKAAPELSPEETKSKESEIKEKQNWFNLIPLKIKFLVGVLASIVVILVIVFVLYRLHRKKRYYKHGY